jgi:hypothetical protein
MVGNTRYLLVRRAETISRQDARELFRNIKKHGSNPGFVEPLMTRVAKKAGHEDLPISVVHSMAKNITIAKSLTERQASVEQMTRGPSPTYSIKLPMRISPSPGQKIAYALGHIGSAAIGLSTLLGATLLTSVIAPSPQGVIIVCSIAVSAITTYFVACKKLISSWKARVGSNLQNIADAVETTINTMLSQVKENQ